MQNDVDAGVGATEGALPPPLLLAAQLAATPLCATAADESSYTVQPVASAGLEVEPLLCLTGEGGSNMCRASARLIAPMQGMGRRLIARTYRVPRTARRAVGLTDEPPRLAVHPRGGVQVQRARCVLVVGVARRVHARQRVGPEGVGAPAVVGAAKRHARAERCGRRRGHG